MFRKKNGQEFMDETNLDSSTNDKEEKKGFFHRKKKKEINLYEDDMGYIEDDSNFDEDEYDKELEELQEEEKPEKKRGFFHRKKKEEEKSGGTEKLEGTKEEEESLLSDDDAIILQEPEKKKFSKKKLALICGTAAVIVIAVVFFVIRNIGGTSEGKAYVESVREITGLGTAGGANNRYTGTVDAEKSWKITLQSDLSVEKRYVNVGDQVKKGDKLFKYNTQELKLSKEKKELEQETLQNEITQLTKDIKSYQSDFKSASASEKIQLQTQTGMTKLMKKSAQDSMKTSLNSQTTLISEYVSHQEDLLKKFSISPMIIDYLKDLNNKDKQLKAQQFTENYFKGLDNWEGIYSGEWNTHVVTHSNPKVVGMTTRKGDSLKALQNAMKENNGLYNAGIIVSPASQKLILSMYCPVYDTDGSTIVGYVGGGPYMEKLESLLNETKKTTKNLYNIRC